MCSAELGTGSFGAFTFFAREHGAEECDSHGLPLTPNTILITGLFQQLKEMPHPFLCEYLDLMKCDSERMICVSEYYIESLESHLLKKISVPIVKLSCQITQALSYLHNKDITVRTLSPDTILFTPEGNVKLFNYGFYHMTNNGTAVDFPIGSPRYLAPELLLLPDNNDVSVAIATKSDIWSLGIILTEVFMESHIYPDLFLKNGLKTLFTRILRLVQNHQRGSASPLLALLDTHGLGDKPIDPPLKEFIEYCLSPQPSQRYSARSLLSLSLIKSSKYSISQKCPSLRDPFSKIVFDSSKVELSSLPSNNLTLLEANVVLKEDYLITCSMKEVYFLWGLAGGGLQSELQKSGVIQKQLPILNIPCVVSKEGEELGMKRNKVHLYDSTVIPLPMDQLRTRLETKSVEDFYPILSDPEEKANDRISIVSTSEHLAQSAKLPLLIKERDIDYQFHRLILYRRLLEGYPYTNEMIITEAIIDVCPLVRGPIWAALLNIQGDIHTTYINIDKVSETQTDRQIAVDIPRCHQYDLLLASSEGHQKFMRILKAWVVAHPKLVYWQGLDSLCAPFLSLNFNNEALAYSSLCGFINKYLHHFFLKDNSYIMQEYLAVFSQIIAYDDPEVFNHLDNIGFHPDLYAIPWFLTMFTHVFPLHKIYHLWDTLLLGNTSFPLFAGLGILIQLRSELLNSGFNECIMMFSDLPDIDIHQCLMEAVQRYQATPSSLCVRQYDVIPIQHSAIPQEARKEPLSLDVLKMECSPQISAHDFLTLCKLEHNVHWYTNMTPPPRKDPNNPLLWRQLEENVETQEVIVLDIRSEEEYRQGHVPNSLNLPHTEAFFTDGSLAPSPVTTYLQEEQHKGHIIVIVANKHDPGPTFARQLVRLNFSHVCLLHGGAGILHSLGILSSV